jgi:hypothetical protein
MRKENRLPNLEPLTAKEMDSIKNKFSTLGYPVKIGG